MDYFLVIGLGLLIVDFVLIAKMRMHGVFQEQASLKRNDFDALGIERDLEVYLNDSFFRLELERAQILLDDANDKETALMLLNWSMNQVTRIGDEKPDGAKSALMAGRLGMGLDCGGMALIFDAALHAVGIRSRIVRLHRCPFSASDQHTTVEARIEDRWIILDPTFHISFSFEDRLLGAADVQNRVMQGDGVFPIFHGEVAYPARLGEYYLPWSVLFNSVSIHDLNCSIWNCLTPLRYKRGPRTCYLEDSMQGVGSVELVRDLYPLATVAFPIAALMSFFFAALQNVIF